MTPEEESGASSWAFTRVARVLKLIFVLFSFYRSQGKTGGPTGEGMTAPFRKLVECLAELVLGVHYDRPVPRVRLLKRLARDETEDGTTFAPFVSAMEPVLRGAAPASQTGTYIEEVMTAKVIPMWNF